MKIQGRGLFSGWSGRILLLNTVIFAGMSLQEGSVFQPRPQVLQEWGGRDAVLLARGEFWRYLTPVFVHIGLLHFLFNNWALKNLGPFMESMLGGWRFLTVYLLSGIAGNVAGSIWTFYPGAGASGALFGLLGCGFLLDRQIRRIEQENPWRRMTDGPGNRRNLWLILIAVNLVFGFLVPGIDNAAHLGGLAGGLTVCQFWLIRLNPRSPRLHRHLAAGGLLVALLLLGAGIYQTSSPALVEGRIRERLTEDADWREKVWLTGNLIRLNPASPVGYGDRLLVLLQQGEFALARHDFLILLQMGPAAAGVLDHVHRVLGQSGRHDALVFLREMQNSLQRPGGSVGSDQPGGSSK